MTRKKQNHCLENLSEKKSNYLILFFEAQKRLKSELDPS